MEEKIRSLIFDYAQRKTGATPALLDLHTTDPWDVHIVFDCLGAVDSKFATSTWMTWRCSWPSATD